MTPWNRIHHVGLHDTGEHEDYFSASYMKILLTDKARRTKYISRILNILEHFYFLHFAFLICASNVVKTWCLILQVVQLAHSLLGKMTHYWLGAIMVLWWGGALSYLSVQAPEVDSQDNNSCYAPHTEWAINSWASLSLAPFSANADRELFSFSIVNLFLSPREQANKQSGKCNFSPIPDCFL